MGVGYQKAHAMVRAALKQGALRPEMVVRITPHGIARRYEGYVLVERPEPS